MANEAESLILSGSTVRLIWSRCPGVSFFFFFYVLVVFGKEHWPGIRLSVERYSSKTTVYRPKLVWGCFVPLWARDGHVPMEI